MWKIAIASWSLDYYATKSYSVYNLSWMIPLNLNWSIFSLNDSEIVIPCFWLKSFFLLDKTLLFLGNNCDWVVFLKVKNLCSEYIFFGFLIMLYRISRNYFDALWSFLDNYDSVVGFPFSTQCNVNFTLNVHEDQSSTEPYCYNYKLGPKRPF